MEVGIEKTKKPGGLKRAKFVRLSKKTKAKIVKEIESGLIRLRPASVKYGVSRQSISEWVAKSKMTTLLLNQPVITAPLTMDDSEQTRLLMRKIQELTKALENAQLRNLALETMIEVAEEHLQIKIRKNRGTKQS
jgi:transposase